MKTNHILATGLLAGGLLFSTAKAQELREVPTTSLSVQEQVAEDTTSVPLLPVKYTGTDSLYDAAPIRQTTVRGLTAKQIKALNKKYPDGISVNSNAFDMTVEDSLDVLDVIDRAVAYTIEFDSLNAEEKKLINFEVYRIRKSIEDAVKSYNGMVKDGKLTSEEISNLLQPKYALPTADLNRLKESLPKDSYDLILSAQNNFNNYIDRVTDITQAAVAQALKTSWYKNWKFTVPATAAVGTATYLITKRKGGKEKVYNTGDWSNNTY